MSRRLKRSGLFILITLMFLPFQNCGGLHTIDPEEMANNHSLEAPTPTPTPGMTPTPTPTPSPTPPISCKKLKKLTYVLQNAVPLQCSSSGNETTLFNVQIPAEGRAFSRVTFDLYNFAQAGDPILGTHSWTGMSSVGDSSYAKRIGGGAGQSVCPGQALQGQQLLSYGRLNSNSKTVSAKIRQYTSANCTHGSLIVQPGAKLEVWVEDPLCEGANIIAGSYFRDVRAQYGVETPFALTTNTQDVLSVNFNLNEDKSALIYGQMEASLPTTTNRCGSQSETTSTVIGLDGSYLGSPTLGVWPVSQGETHIALYPATAITKIAKGSHRVHLAAAVNQGVNSGRAKVGLDHSADTIFGMILNHDFAEVASPVSIGRPYKILPLGDSITLGYEDTSTAEREGANGGYRYPLYLHLSNRGFKFNFVGGLSNGPSALPEKNHQGMAGWRIDQIYSGVVNNGWVRNTQPDLVLLHVGTNDFFQQYDLQNSPGRLSALLDQIYADAPNAKILVAKIVPMPLYQNLNAYVADYNNSVGLIVAQKQAQGRAVYAIDMNSALSNAVNSPDFCADQAHPNNQGYNKMSVVWLNALVQLMGILP